MSKLVTGTLILSLLSGTAIGQKKYQPPAVKTPDTFRGTDPAAATDQNSIGDLKWFEVFKDEELQKLLKTAIVQNYDFRAAVARINAARANLGLTRSNQFPQIEASTDLTTTRFSQNGQFTIPGEEGTRRSVGSVMLNLLSFELDIWGRRRNETKAARAQLRASEEDRKAVITTVVSDVATGYFSLIELDQSTVGQQSGTDSTGQIFDGATGTAVGTNGVAFCATGTPTRHSLCRRESGCSTRSCFRGQESLFPDH